MMNLPQHVYLVGIGGIGMSALAQLLQHQGKEVIGSDREEAPTTALLAKKGVKVWIGHDTRNIPADCEMLIYSDAVPESNLERQRAKKMGINEMSYFEALGEVSKVARTIAVAGTHGKTTTTGMLAKILHDTGAEPTAIIRSIVQDFGSNFLPGRSDLLVVEACEYRDHLLKLSPEILVITNIELDHTDYFPDLPTLQQTFRNAAEKVPSHGYLIADLDLPNVADVLKNVKATIVDYRKKAVGSLQLIGEFN